jgi:hypothetical protein
MAMVVPMTVFADPMQMLMLLIVALTLARSAP